MIQKMRLAQRRFRNKKSRKDPIPWNSRRLPLLRSRSLPRLRLLIRRWILLEIWSQCKCSRVSLILIHPQAATQSKTPLPHLWPLLTKIHISTILTAHIWVHLSQMMDITWAQPWAHSNSTHPSSNHPTLQTGGALLLSQHINWMCHPMKNCCLTMSSTYRTREGAGSCRRNWMMETRSSNLISWIRCSQPLESWWRITMGITSVRNWSKPVLIRIRSKHYWCHWRERWVWSALIIMEPELCRLL